MDSVQSKTGTDIKKPEPEGPGIYLKYVSAVIFCQRKETEWKLRIQEFR